MSITTNASNVTGGDTPSFTLIYSRVLKLNLNTRGATLRAATPRPTLWIEYMFQFMLVNRNFSQGAWLVGSWQKIVYDFWSYDSKAASQSKGMTEHICQLTWDLTWTFDAIKPLYGKKHLVMKLPKGFSLISIWPWHNTLKKYICIYLSMRVCIWSVFKIRNTVVNLKAVN